MFIIFKFIENYMIIDKIIIFPVYGYGKWKKNGNALRGLIHFTFYLIFLQLFHYDVRIKNNVAGDSELF